MYLAKILRNLTELGFIQWARVDKGEDVYETGCFQTKVSNFTIKVATFKIKKGAIIKNIYTYFTLTIYKVEGIENHEESIGEGTGDFLSLWLIAKQSSEKIARTDLQKELIQELIQQLKINII